MRLVVASSNFRPWLLVLFAAAVGAVGSTALRTTADDAAPSAIDEPTPATPPGAAQPVPSPRDISLPRAPLNPNAPVRRRPVVTVQPTPADFSPPEATPPTTNAIETEPTPAAAPPSEGTVSIKKPDGPSSRTSPTAQSPVAVASPSINTESPFATTFADPPALATQIDAASFNGVQPGTTTHEQLTASWGAGKETARDGGAMVLSYSAENFPRIDVRVEAGTVQSIAVHLAAPTAADTLAKQLQIDAVRPVPVPDENGELLGQAYPERGVLFSFARGNKRVAEIIIEQIDAESFVLRAEHDWRDQPQRALADVNYVLSKQPNNARALSIKANVLFAAARYEEAQNVVDAALAAEPGDVPCQLLRGKILGARGLYEEAAEQTKSVLAAKDVTELHKAQALCQLGDLLAASPAHDFKQAMEHHTAAIQLADPLSVDKRLSIRRAAKETLVTAHLGVAGDICGGFWQQKEKIAPKWLERAQAYADDLIANEDGSEELKLQVARGALAACHAAQGKLDGVPWTRTAIVAGKKLIAAADDPWRKAQLEWELGVALFDGLYADDARGALQHSLANSTLTATYLEAGAKGRAETPETAFLLGRLYYRIGSLHAVGRADHKTAVTWYEKAWPLIDRPLPRTQLALQGRYGEWLVSMGISYWELNRREEAIDLTDAGVKHVEEAVRLKLVDAKALAVPYSNLAAMHQTLGHKNEAKNFAEMAAKFEGTKRR